jgi:hypothetical protein
MPKNIKIALPLFVGLAVIAFFASSSLTRAQRTLSGEWKASIKEDRNKLQLNLERRTEKGGHNQMGQSYEFSELQGLTREQAANGGPVKFSLVREAGRIDLEGTSRMARAQEHFSLQPTRVLFLL